jgi:GTPase
MGGRKTKIFNGYSPAFKIRNDQMFNGGKIAIINKEELEPGETTDAFITFIAPELVKGYLRIGSKILFCESPERFIGEAIVIEIFDL